MKLINKDKYTIRKPDGSIVTVILHPDEVIQHNKNYEINDFILNIEPFPVEDDETEGT
jgi:hypothetical protein